MISTIGTSGGSRTPSSHRVGYLVVPEEGAMIPLVRRSRSDGPGRRVPYRKLSIRGPSSQALPYRGDPSPSASWCGRSGCWVSVRTFPGACGAPRNPSPRTGIVPPRSSCISAGCPDSCRRRVRPGSPRRTPIQVRASCISDSRHRSRRTSWQRCTSHLLRHSFQR